MSKSSHSTKSEQMSRVRSTNTDIEIALRKALWARGLRYRVNYKLTGRPDVVFVTAKIAVFVDGCFWHGCPQHFTQPKKNAAFWKKKIGDNIARDRRIDAELTLRGWSPFRVWGHEVLENPEDVANRIAKAVGGMIERGELRARGAAPLGGETTAERRSDQARPAVRSRHGEGMMKSR